MQAAAKALIEALWIDARPRVVLMGQLEAFEQNARSPAQQALALRHSLPGVGFDGAPVVSAEAYFAGAAMASGSLRRDLARNLGFFGNYHNYLFGNQFDPEAWTAANSAKRVKTMRCVRIDCARVLLPRARALDAPHLLRRARGPQIPFRVARNPARLANPAGRDLPGLEDR